MKSNESQMQEQPPPVKAVQVWLEPSLWRRVRLFAEEREVKLSVFVSDAIEEKLRRDGPKSLRARKGAA